MKHDKKRGEDVDTIPHFSSGINPAKVLMFKLFQMHGKN